MSCPRRDSAGGLGVHGGDLAHIEDDKVKSIMSWVDVIAAGIDDD